MDQAEQAATGEGQRWPHVPITTSVAGKPVPITIEGGCAVASDVRYEHCAIAKQAGFPILVYGVDREITRPCVVVGSGPSAVPLLEEIRSRYQHGEEIIAVKGAHDWLVANGIIPTAAIALDPQQSRAKCFKRLRDDVLYCCASQMHPDTWTHLKGRRVLIWHSRIGISQEQLEDWKTDYIVPCVSTTGNSALILMYLLGRRRFELYGFDSSLPPATGLERFRASVLGRLLKLDGARVANPKHVVSVVLNGRCFESTTPMIQQAAEIEFLLQNMPGVKLNAHGVGYYQAIIEEGKAKGWPI